MYWNSWILARQSAIKIEFQAFLVQSALFTISYLPFQLFEFRYCCYVIDFVAFPPFRFFSIIHLPLRFSLVARFSQSFHLFICENFYIVHNTCDCCWRYIFFPTVFYSLPLPMGSSRMTMVCAFFSSIDFSQLS